MEGLNRSFVLALVFVAMALVTVRAQNTPEDYLTPHNAARAAVGVGPMVWDTTVEAYAQNYANQRIGDCNLIHSGGGGLYGENLYGGPGNQWTAGDAVALWVSEEQYYDYPTNTCAAGQTCGHYTQVVWRDSVSLGCARVSCDNGGTFIICNYSPQGNIIVANSYCQRSGVHVSTTVSCT